jgi:phycoerythrin-associated linker protein
MPNATIELWQTDANADVQTAIRAVYKYVLGNPHVMESERLVSAESQLCDRSMSVREFVRAVGKSGFYSRRYFETCSPYRLVELNYMHFLGRPPESQAEASAYMRLMATSGFEASIDFLVDSAEYQAQFGEDTVPYNRGSRTESGLSQVTYNRSFAVDRGPAQVSSSVKASQLVASIAGGGGNKIKASTATITGSGTEKRFRITVTSRATPGAARRLSKTEYIVSAEKMTPTIQRIGRSGGKIATIVEI